LLTVEKNGTNYEMDFPSWKLNVLRLPDGIAEILGVKKYLVLAIP
jgi:hypothetical protein